MPYPDRMYRVAIQAALQDGETMVHTFHVKGVVALEQDQPPVQELADGVRAKWQAGLGTVYGTTSWASHLSPRTTYQKVTAYKINPTTGRATDLAEAVFTTGNVGTSSGSWPTEVALCATLGTGFPGRTRRGRMYLGGLGVTSALTASGRVSPACQQAASGFLAKFFRDVRDIGVIPGEQDDWEPQLVSTTTGSAKKITTVSVGDVFDVQRRRRNKIAEGRVQANVG